MTDNPIVPDNQDVLCGSGRQVARHPGNQRFRTIVMNNYESFMQATTKTEKMKVTQRIQDAVLIEGGQFLKKHPIFDQWYLASSKVGRDKISHSLREIKKNIMVVMEGQDDTPPDHHISDEGGAGQLEVPEGDAYCPPGRREEYLLIDEIPQADSEEKIGEGSFQLNGATAPLRDFEQQRIILEEINRDDEIDQPFQRESKAQDVSEKECGAEGATADQPMLAKSEKTSKASSPINTSSKRKPYLFSEKKAATESFPSQSLDSASLETLKCFQRKAEKDGDRKMSREEGRSRVPLSLTRRLPNERHLSQPPSVLDDSKLLANSSPTSWMSMATLPQNTTDQRRIEEDLSNDQAQISSSRKPNKYPLVASSPFLKLGDLSAQYRSPKDDEYFIKVLGPLGQPRVFDPSKEKNAKLCNEKLFKNVQNTSGDQCFTMIGNTLEVATFSQDGKGDDLSFLLNGEKEEDI